MGDSFTFDPTTPQLPTPKATDAGAVDLSLSLDEIVNTKKEERRQERVEKRKNAQAQKKNSEPKGDNKKKQNKNNSNSENREHRKAPREESAVREGPKSFQINIPEDTLRSILEKAGVDTRNYTVTLYAVPKKQSA